MANLYDRIGAIRDRLRHPRANRPGDGDCLRSLCDHLKILRAKRRNTGKPWDFADKKINVQANKAKYQVGDNRVGVPFAILTLDESNPNHYQRLVPFFSPQNLAFNWGLPNNVATWNVNFDGSTHSAERVAFYWSNGVPYCEFQPTPALPATYLFRFVVGDSVDMMSLAEDLSLGEVGDTLAEIRAAFSLLEFAEWEDNKTENKELRTGLGITLDWEEKLAASQFDAAALIPIGSNVGQLWMPE
jgi:hypothetical protein